MIWIELLVLGTFVALALRQLNFPYLVALVLLGLGMMMSKSIEVDPNPDLLLAIVIPPLIFATAREIRWDELRGNIKRILLTAVPGVLTTTLIVGGMMSLLTSLALPVAVMFGALISTTGPFAGGALFRNSRISRRLAVLVGGESLLSTGIAITVFSLVLTIVLTGQFQFLNELGDFVRILIGGVAVGLGLGWLISRLAAWSSDNLIETVLTTLLPFISYLLAERLHVSGALAVIAAGLINGSLRSHSTLSRPWEFLALVANSLIFLLIGLQISLPTLLGASQMVLWAITAVIVARALVIYGLNGFFQPTADRIPITWLHVWNWSGLRGAIGMVLVLSLPLEFNEFRELLIATVLGVVLFTLLVQATTMRVLLHWLGLEIQSPESVES